LGTPSLWATVVADFFAMVVRGDYSVYSE